MDLENFFETKCQKAKVNHNYIKILMDQSFAESKNYHKPVIGLVRN